MAPNKKAVEKKRAMKAVKEMTAFGFPMEKTKPILNKLLEAYDYGWDFIEDANYSVLVEQLISSDDAEESMGDKNDLDDYDDEGDGDDIGADLCRKSRKRKLDDDSLSNSGISYALEMDSTPSTHLVPRSHYCLDIKGKRVALGFPNETDVILRLPETYMLPGASRERDYPVQYAESMKKNGIPMENEDRSSDHSGSPRIVPPIAVIPPLNTFFESASMTYSQGE